MINFSKLYCPICNVKINKDHCIKSDHYYDTEYKKLILYFNKNNYLNPISFYQINENLFDIRIVTLSSKKFEYQCSINSIEELLKIKNKIEENMVFQ